MAKMKLPKAVRDAFFDMEIGFNESGSVEMDKEVLRSPHVSLEAKGFYAWTRSKSFFDDYDVDKSLAQAVEPEFFEQMMQELVDEGIALRHLYAIDEDPSYQVFDGKMTCFCEYLVSLANDLDVDACEAYVDYVDSLMPKDREKLLSKVLP